MGTARRKHRSASAAYGLALALAASGCSSHEVPGPVATVTIEVPGDASGVSVTPTAPVATPIAPVTSSEVDRLTLPQSVDIALDDAGLAEEDTTVVEQHAYENDGVEVNSVTFLTAGARYHYEIDASNGRILASYVNPLASGTHVDAAMDEPSLSASGALEVALSDAGVPQSEAREWDVDLAYDGGVPVYEVEFETVMHDFEYWVNGVTGAVIDSYRERD